MPRVFVLLMIVPVAVGCTPKNASQFRKDVAAQQRVGAVKGSALGAVIGGAAGAAIGALLPIPGGAAMGTGIGAA